QGKADKAKAVFASMTREELLRGNLAQPAAQVLLLSRDPERARELALAAVREDSRDYRDHLWLGELLAQAARTAEEKKKAEYHLRRAVELEEKEPEPWVTLVAFLASQQRKAEAEEVLKRAGARVKPEQAPQMLARCYAQVGDLKEARARYEAALKARPQDAGLLIDYANFSLQRGQLADAEPVLRRLLDGKLKLTDEQAEWGHTRLALLLSYDRSFQRFREALPHVGLRLEKNGTVARDARLVKAAGIEVKRAAARVLATQPQWRCRDEAIKRFEELEQRQALNADDRYILAHLYEAKGD